MNKKILDVDALEKLLEWIVDNEEYVNDFVDVDGDYVHAYSLKEKIQELATPEPQGVWYDDFTKAPDEYIAHNGCRLAWVDHDTITPLGDISAFDEDYFRQSMKQWQYMPQVPNGY